MIRVTIDMVPGGIESRARHMATIEIVNNIVQSVVTQGRTGEYTVKFSRISQHGEHLGWYDRIVNVKGINRRESGAVYRILHKALGEFLK